MLYVPPWERIPTIGPYIRPAMAFGLAFTYPFYVSNMFDIPIFGVWPDVSTGVYMLVFIMMAIGLNIVVGYAGLLDLGYVAFYAIGSYTVAWFASSQFAGLNVHFWDTGVGGTVPGIHISIWLLLAARRHRHRRRRDPHRPAHTAAARRLPGDRHPRLRRDPPPDRAQRRQLLRHRVQPDQRAERDRPDRLARIRELQLPDRHGTFFTSERLFFWTAILLVLFTIFCSLRLLDSRLGRAWVAIREDETAASAMGVPLMRTKTWAYAGGAFFGGIAGAYYASFKSATFPGDFFFNISVFILCMVILGGMGNIWGVILGAAFLSYLDREGLANTGAWLNQHLSLNIEVPKYEFGIFGVILVVVMLFRPEGLIPSTRRKAEFEVGVHDQPLYDLEHE